MPQPRRESLFPPHGSCPSGREAAATSERLDVLFREMDRMICEEPDTSNSFSVLREREIASRAFALWERAMCRNDAAHPLMGAVRRPALGQAVRDLLGTWPEPSARSCAETAPLVRLLDALEETPLSEEFCRVEKAMQGRMSNANRVAEAVRSDPVLAALLLRLVNSPFYGVGRRVDSLQRAVAFAGFDELSALALVVAVVRAFGGSSGFWRRSVLCGVLSKALARRAGLSGQWFFAAGLLHDVGGLLARMVVPGTYGAFVRSLADGATPWERLEKKYLGITTPELGVRLLSRKGMPESVAELVGRRRGTGSSEDPGTAALHVAEVLAASMTVGRSSGDVVIPELHVACWEMLGLGVRDVETLLPEALAQAVRIAGGMPGLPGKK